MTVVNSFQARTVEYFPQYNGVAERMNRTLVECVPMSMFAYTRISKFAQNVCKIEELSPMNEDKKPTLKSEEGWL